MRLFLPVAVSALFAMPALAQPIPTGMPFPMAIPSALSALAGHVIAQIAPPTTQVAMPVAAPDAAQAAEPMAAPAPAAESTPAPKRPAHHRESQQERFAKANTTHDGHLTLAQAKIGYKSIVRHFAEIDTTNQGYITEAQISAWEKAEREKHAAARQAAGTTPKG